MLRGLGTQMGLAPPSRRPPRRRLIPHILCRPSSGVDAHADPVLYGENGPRKRRGTQAGTWAAVPILARPRTPATHTLGRACAENTLDTCGPHWGEAPP